MLHAIFILTTVTVLVIIIFVVYRKWKVNQQNIALNKKRFERIRLIYDRLENNSSLTREDILPFAKNILTREGTFQLLKDFNKTELFPEEFYTLEKAAESHLANWLEFPTELGICPDEIVFLQNVILDFDDEKNLPQYILFKFKTNEPHWAAKDGWLVGVVGPYSEHSNPYDFTPGLFSRFNVLDTVSLEEEARWVHQHITMR